MGETCESGWRHRTRTPVLIVTACAWLALVEVTAVQQPTMRHMGAPDHPGETPGLLLVLALMTVSMMAPLVIEPLRHGLARSLRRRRPRAVALLLAGHLAVWLAGAIALQGLASLLRQVSGGRTLAVAVAVALVWQATPTAHRLANRHHARPALAAFGAAADADVVSYGVRHAASCLGACWPVMLVPEVSGAGALIAMALGSFWIWALALDAPVSPRWRLPWPGRATRLAVTLVQPRWRMRGSAGASAALAQPD